MVRGGYGMQSRENNVALVEDHCLQTLEGNAVDPVLRKPATTYSACTGKVACAQACLISVDTNGCQVHRCRGD